MTEAESRKHIEKCREILGKSSAPAYLKRAAENSIRYHEDLIGMEGKRKGSKRS